MEQRQALLRNIPKVDEVLGYRELLSVPYSHNQLTEAVRQELDGLRQEILRGTRVSLPDPRVLSGQVVKRAERNAAPSLRRMINATGVILHTNLGRAPLAAAAVQAVCDAAKGYSNLEYDAAKGERGSRHSHIEKLLTRLTGAEAAMAVNNNAAAVLLALSAICQGKEVLVSRGELVEIGGAFRIPDVMEQSGCVLREVGTTNRTRIQDYERAVDPERTGALFKAHTSNFRMIGFTEEVPPSELAALGKKKDLPFLYDLGSGSLYPMDRFGLHDEPSVIPSVGEGADLLCFSGDKLLGGPQAGIVVGKKALVEKMKRHPLARALRIDKMTLAALEATLRLYLDPETAAAQVPVLAMLGETRSALREKAERLLALAEPVRSQLRVLDVESPVGGGSAPGHLFASAAVEAQPTRLSVVELEKRLRNRAIPIIARIANDRLLLDVRTVEEADLPLVAEGLLAALGEEA